MYAVNLDLGASSSFFSVVIIPPLNNLRFFYLKSRVYRGWCIHCTRILVAALRSLATNEIIITNKIVISTWLWGHVCCSALRCSFDPNVLLILLLHAPLWSLDPQELHWSYCYTFLHVTFTLKSSFNIFTIYTLKNKLHFNNFMYLNIILELQWWSLSFHSKEYKVIL